MPSANPKTPMMPAPQGRAEEPVAEPRFVLVRLAVLIFAAFTIMGAWVPSFTLHLKALGFSPEATAWASSTNALGAILAPLLWGQIADRWLATERCISLCALITGILLFLLAELRDPTAVFFMSLSVWFFLLPTISLTGAFIFRQVEHPEREYGKIRLWGTVGWMAANWSLTGWFALGAWLTGVPGQNNDFGDSLRLGAIAAFLVAGYALTMPHAPPSKPAGASGASFFGRVIDAPLSAIRMFRQPSFAVYCISMFGLYITVPFTVQLNPLLLERLEVSPTWVPVALTIAQSTEVLALALLPWLLLRLGVKGTMILGCVAWTIGLTLFGIGGAVPVVLGALAPSGIFICCFVISGQVFVNRQAAQDIRASVQGLLVVINGSGLFLGHLLVGWLRDWAGDRYELAYRVAAGMAFGLGVLFVMGFTAPPQENSSQEELVPDANMP